MDKQSKPRDDKPARDTGKPGVHGEGNYEATRKYNEGLKDHVQHHDIEKEARDAAPRSASEEQEMEEAERFAKSKSRGEGGSPDDPEDQQDVVK